MASTPAPNVTKNQTSDCYPQDVLPTWFFLVLNLFIVVTGTCANVFSLFVSCQHIKQRNELGIYLFNLALSDLCFIIFLPIWIQYMNNNDVWPYGSTMCIIAVFLQYTNYYTSAMLLSCIAADRYLAIVHPFSLHFLRKFRTAVIISVTVWISSLIVNGVIISPDMIFNEEDMVCLDVFPLQPAHRKVYIARFVLGWLLPSGVVVYCHWNICIEVRTNKATPLSERRRVFKLMVSVLLSLSLCFGPLHIALLLRAALESCKPPSWLFLFYQIGKALSCLNCLADPLLYCFITRTGRSSVTQAILKLKRKEATHSDSIMARKKIKMETDI